MLILRDSYAPTSAAPHPLLPCAQAVAAAHKRGKGTDSRYHSIQGRIRSAALLGRVNPEYLEHLQRPLYTANELNVHAGTMPFFSSRRQSQTFSANFATLHHP